MLKIVILEYLKLLHYVIKTIAKKSLKILWFKCYRYSVMILNANHYIKIAKCSGSIETISFGPLKNFFLTIRTQCNSLA